MPSPFPGLDPFIEDQGHWPDLHARLIVLTADALEVSLPDTYVAMIEQQIHLVSPGEELGERIRPDMMVVRGGRPGRAVPRAAEAVALAEPETAIEPVIVPLAAEEDEVRDRWIEIRKLPDLRLVTVIEFLSPSNKIGTGRDEYRTKRAALLAQAVHLVEIDLLLRGRRMPMARPLPRGDCFATVARSDRRPDAEVYAWSLRRPLPTIPIPLEAPDPDVPLDLASVFATAYERGRYARFLDYAAPLSLPLADEDRAWAEAIARAGRTA